MFTQQNNSKISRLIIIHCQNKQLNQLISLNLDLQFGLYNKKRLYQLSLFSPKSFMTEHQKNSTPKLEQSSPTKTKPNSVIVSVNQQSEINQSTRKESMIMDLEFDQMRILKEFQVKRKLLMKALKQKQKEKMTISSQIQPMPIKEGITQKDLIQQFDLKRKEFAESSLDQKQFFKPKPPSFVWPLMSEKNDTYNALNEQKISIGIQTLKPIEKTKKIKKSSKQSLNKYDQQKQKEIQKEIQMSLMKKVKKTEEEINEIKNQLTFLFIKKQNEHSFDHSLNSSQSALTSVNDFYEATICSIETINTDMQTYYENKYLKSLILTQFKNRFNLRKNCNDNKQNFSSSSQKKKINKKYSSKKSRNSSQEVSLTKYEMAVKLEQNKRLQTSQKKPSNKRSFKAKRKFQRRLINQRFKLVLEKQSTEINPQLFLENNQQQSSESTQKEIEKEQSINGEIYKNESNSLGHSQKAFNFFKEESDTQQSFDYMESWTNEFQKQAKVIYEKFPNLRNLPNLKKTKQPSSQTVQLEKIEKYCKTVKINTAKTNKKQNRRIQKQEKVKETKKNQRGKKTKNQEVEIYYGSEQQQQDQVQKKPWEVTKRTFPLKQIQFDKNQVDQLGISFDNRSKKEEFDKSYKLQIDPKDDSIYNALSESNDKSRDFNLLNLSTMSNAHEEKQKSREKARTIKHEILQRKIIDHESNSKGDNSVSKSGSSEDNTILKQKDWSFFKSHQGVDYLNMSGSIG